MGTTRRILSSAYRLSAVRRVSGFRTVSDEAVVALAKAIPIDILADEMRRIYFHRLECPGTIGSYKSGGTKDFHAQMAVTMGEQFKGKVDISPYLWCNSLDEEQSLRAELVRDPVPNWSWVLQEVPAQI